MQSTGSYKRSYVTKELEVWKRKLLELLGRDNFFLHFRFSIIFDSPYRGFIKIYFT